jgi:primosomal protein N' (replication factor Y)
MHWDIMEFVDIIFPQKIGVLTYKVPAHLRQEIRPGVQVLCELRKAQKAGIALGAAKEIPPGKLKPITEVLHDAPALSEEMIKLISWMTEYYMALPGTVLKSILPGEFFSPVKRRGAKAPESPDSPDSIGSIHEPFTPYDASSPISKPDSEANTDDIDGIKESVKQEKYNTFLLHAASTIEEQAFIAESVRGTEGVIVACPDLSVMRMLEVTLKSIYGDGLVLLHSKMSKGQRTEAIKKIAAGEATAVLGSLQAVFAPLPKLKMIVIAHEESPLYKSESAPRSSARDVAVMRAYLEGATVLLSSICPSLESWHNADIGKYTLIDQTKNARRPRVRILVKDGVKKAFTDKLISSITHASRNGYRTLLHVNRKGHSTLKCSECGYIDLCPSCNVPLVFHKQVKNIRCALCAYDKEPGNVCPECGGHDFDSAGTGLERIEEEFRALNPVGVDTNSRENINLLLDDETRLAVGTNTLTRSDALCGEFKVVGVVNADAFMSHPDFRAEERAMQDLMYAVDKTAPDGELLIQTLRPRHLLYSNLRQFNLKAFYKRELKQRLEPGFPPFSRLAIIRATGSKPPRVDHSAFNDAEVLGPVGAQDKKGRKHFKLLVKAANSSLLQSAVLTLKKQFKGYTIEVDVDPLEL